MQGKPGDFVPLALFIAIPIAALTAAFVYFVRASSIPSDQPPLTERDAPTPIEQSRRIGYWISSIVLGLLYVVVGLPKITPLFLVDIIHDFEKWGYSEQFQYFIGATEFVSGIFLMIPRTSFYVAIYLSIVMVGAIYTGAMFLLCSHTGLLSEFPRLRRLRGLVRTTVCLRMREAHSRLRSPEVTARPRGSEPL